METKCPESSVCITMLAKVWPLMDIPPLKITTDNQNKAIEKLKRHDELYGGKRFLKRGCVEKENIKNCERRNFEAFDFKNSVGEIETCNICEYQSCNSISTFTRRLDSDITDDSARLGLNLIYLFILLH